MFWMPLALWFTTYVGMPLTYAFGCAFATEQYTVSSGGYYIEFTEDIGSLVVYSDFGSVGGGGCVGWLDVTGMESLDEANKAAKAIYAAEGKNAAVWKDKGGDYEAAVTSIAANGKTVEEKGLGGEKNRDLILSLNREQLKALPPLTILTPHPAEYHRMAADESPADFSSRIGVVLVLKGHPTHIFMPDGRQYICPWGNSGMATAGSGDVLTGILCGLLAQGYTSEETALLGTSLHALAGDAAADRLGEHSVVASDIIDNLPDAFSVIKAKA